MEQMDIRGLSHREINDKLRGAEDECVLENCLGQRFLGAAMHGKELTIHGTPGNALGAYFNGGRITVHGNAQDAVGDTMNEGVMVIHGNIGDAAGYAMRGGKIFVNGDAGYRAGIHMKAYKEKVPALVIGGSAGSFLGEYQAGGIIVVLGLKTQNEGGRCVFNGRIVGNFPCTGMHGGKMLLRSDCAGVAFPKNVTAHAPTEEEMAEFIPHIREFCEYFGYDEKEILSSPFTLVTPDSHNPYKQMYVMN